MKYNTDQAYMNRFVSRVPDSIKTPSMQLVLDINNQLTFSAPRGFQIDRYVSSHWYDDDYITRTKFLQKGNVDVGWLVVVYSVDENGEATRIVDVVGGYFE